ncbi:MAG TPA: hypothetical protein PLK30_11890 [Blastocatellia bacterium]|nr:hypothetical protein [Blastocatellia bacterium]
MKRNKTARRWLRKRKRAVKGGLAKLVALTGETPSKRDLQQISAPAENHNNDSGILRQDTTAFRLPNALAEAGEGEHHHWMPSGFVFLVVGLAIVFIAIVAWQVSQMPPK